MKLPCFFSARRAGLFFLFGLFLLVAFQPALSPATPGSSTVIHQPATACFSEGWPWDRSDLQPDPALVYGTLDNGLRYVILKNSEPKGRVGLYLNVQAGSLYETDRQRGLAHYLEHMLFNGTSHYPPGTLVSYLQSRGMGFGADSNAHTAYDETVYNLLLPGNTEKDLDEGLLILADYARGALLLEKEVDKERGIILAEKRTRDSAATRVAKKRLKFEFAGTRVAVRDPIGTEESLAAANSTRLRSYYDAWYRPDNMIVVVVGDVDPVSVRQIIVRRLGGLKAAGTTADCPSFGRVAEHGTDVLYLHEPDLGYTEVSIETVWNVQPQDDSSAWEIRQLKNYVAASILNNRLRKLVSREGSPLTRARVYSGILLQRVGYSALTARTDSNTWDAALSLLLTTLRQAMTYGFAPEELARVKKEIMADLEKEVQTTEGRDSRKLASDIIRKVNLNQVFLSPQQERTLYAQALAGMSIEDVNAAFRDSWNHDRRLVMVAGTAKIGSSDQQAEMAIRKVFAAAGETPLTTWVRGAGVSFPYLPVSEHGAAVLDHVEKPEIGADMYTLAGGVVLNIKQTDFKKNEVLVTIHFGDGQLAEPRPGLARLAESVIRESGVGRLTREQLDEAKAGHSAQVNFRVGRESFFFNGKGLSTELEFIFQLLQAHLVDPAFRSQAYQISMGRFAQMYGQMKSSVEGEMQLAGERFLAGGNSRYGMVPEKEFEQLTLDEVRNWLQPVMEHGCLEITVVGDVDTGRVVDLAARYFAGTGRNLQPSAKGERIDFPAGRKLELEVPTGIDKAMIVVAWPTADFWDISRTRRLNVLASVLEDRLRRKIREDLGATYSPLVYNRSSRVDPGYGVLRSMLTVAPQQAEQLSTIIRQAGARLADEGVGSEELGRALKPTLTSIRDMMRNNRYWRDSVLALSSRHPVQLRWPLNIQEDFASITPEEINRLAARYLQPEPAARIVIRPETKKR